ncbi:GSCOCG00005955001-RA-CDS, partial [Cotesia congregata]
EANKLLRRKSHSHSTFAVRSSPNRADKAGHRQLALPAGIFQVAPSLESTDSRLRTPDSALPRIGTSAGRRASRCSHRRGKADFAFRQLGIGGHGGRAQEDSISSHVCPTPGQVTL